MPAADFESLVAEAAAAPVDGWGFAWLDGRATEERPSWGYARTLPHRLAPADSVLDVQTGGAEVFGEALDRTDPRPRIVAATEAWPPNRAIAHRNLAPAGGIVLAVAENGAFPLRDATFDLVTSRHPVVTRWDEIARVLRPGGRYFAQHVGSGSNRALTDFVMGPQPLSGTRRPERARADAEAHALEVVDLRAETLRVEFYDIGAVVWFLRKVIWTVPGFTVEAYREPLRRLHGRIVADGSFVSSSERFLIEAVRTG